MSSNREIVMYAIDRWSEASIDDLTADTCMERRKVLDTLNDLLGAGLIKRFLDDDKKPCYRITDAGRAWLVSRPEPKRNAQPAVAKNTGSEASVASLLSAEGDAVAPKAQAQPTEGPGMGPAPSAAPARNVRYSYIHAKEDTYGTPEAAMQAAWDSDADIESMVIVAVETIGRIEVQPMLVREGGAA